MANVNSSKTISNSYVGVANRMVVLVYDYSNRIDQQPISTRLRIPTNSILDDSAIL